MMLEKIQQSMNSPIMKFVMFIIIVFFIGAGYFGANMFGGDPNRIAEVDGVSISSQRVQSQIDQMRQRDGQAFEQRYPTEASREQLRQTIAQQLINSEVIVAGVARAGFAASEEQVKEWIRTNEIFQINGEYSARQAREILRQNGMSEDRLAEMAREEIAREQLQNGLTSSGFALSNEVATLYRLQEQSRDVRVLRVPISAFTESVDFGDEAINEYYQNNQSQFQQPEQINLKYVRLSVENLIEENKSDVTEEQIEAFYEAQKSNYQEVGEIQVAHILIDNSVENAKSKAEQLLEQLKQGADFAQLAEENSSDTFSAENGGQLDWVDAVEQSDESAGTGWAPEFEQAALSLESRGDISDIVETSFGFHIIKLLDKRPGSTTPLEEVRDDIITELAEEAATEEFYEKESKLNEMLFEYGDDIQKFAEQVGLTVEETGLFSRQSATGVAAEPALLEKAFTAQVIDSTDVSDEIELGNKDIIYVTATDYKAESVKPLEEVKAQIVATLTQQKAAEAAEEFASNVMDALKSGDSVDDMVSSKELEWQENADLKRRDSEMKFDLVSAIYQLPAPAEGESVIDSKSLFNGDYAVIELKAVNYPDPSDMDESKREQLQQMAKNLNTQVDTGNLIQYFQNTVEVKK
ncbi:SurA N-terminal domain-containing protein [Kangiella sediminilitoris]|uniref:Periplasmic chaperone PpiD n=1 Tax=Kangiella sediminilitoris TaxID=1144748 RepID=A0A1B3B973_9GAMM|nr:SurA N-terminal domain-containing protein [Kangiella sediminilitoris]AOE49347.1 PpiC-type peptidyl-prolyl cis-trans isomerase [Kangiella sediminilitoris]